MRRPLPRLPVAALAAALSAVALCACPIGRPDDDDERDGGPDGTGFGDPRTDLTAALGGDDTLEIASWNLKNFPCGNESFSTVCRADPAASVELVTDLIASMDLDVVAVEEIADEDAFDEIVQRLPDHGGRLSTHTYGDGTYQKIGVIYKESVLEPGNTGLLFQSNFNFPRPAFQMELTWKGPGEPFTFLVVALHLKAGEAGADRAERTGAVVTLEQYARNLVDGAGNDNIIMLGDFNETLDAQGLPVFEPLRDGSRYFIRTLQNANARESTFLPSRVILDHIVTTNALDAVIGASPTVIPRLDVDVEDYRGRVSDHLPVTLSFANP